MKKTLIISLVFICVAIGSTGADALAPSPLFTLKALDFTLELAPQDALFPNFVADNFSIEPSLRYMMLPASSERPAFIYNFVNDSSHTVGLKGSQFDAAYSQIPSDHYIVMKAGVEVPILRFTFGGWGVLPKVAIEGIVKGGMRTVFNAFEKTDQLGMDGTYMYGLNARLGSFLSFTYGRKHYSAHYGDEIMAIAINYNKPGATGEYADPSFDPTSLRKLRYDYVRENPITYGLCLSLGPYFKLYGELRVGDTAKINKPVLYDRDDPQFANFHSREIQFGCEMGFKVPKLGPFIVAFDATLREDGKFLLVPTADAVEYKGQYSEYVYTYENDAPWALDWEISIAQELSENSANSVRLQISYHHGRFPLFAYGMHKVSYFSLGFDVSI